MEELDDGGYLKKKDKWNDEQFVRYQGIDWFLDAEGNGLRKGKMCTKQMVK